MKVFWVSKRLSFGSAITTWKHVEQLQALGVTHVINLRRNHGKKVSQFKNLWLPFRDNKKPRPARFYRRALRFHRRAMRHTKPKVFVMCHHGLCRSPSLAYFLLRASGLSWRDAETLVRRARPSAQIVRAYRESGEEYLRRIKRWQNI